MSPLARAGVTCGMVVALVLGARPTASAQAGAKGSKADRILFIGNSLTAWNDLPLLVEAVARSAGHNFECEAVTFPDFSLEDHWRRGTIARVREGGWKYVVLQQGPSSLPSSRENLREWTKRFAAEIRGVGATPALYMVWPDQSRLRFLPDVQESYRLASEDVGGVLLPVGRVWEALWKTKPRLGLYGPDGFHPSRLGTLAAAVTMATALSGRSLDALPPVLKLRNGTDYKVDRGDATLLLAAVAAITRPATP